MDAFDLMAITGESIIELITTGGTIDKYYNPIAGCLLIGKPAAPAILGEAGIFDVRTTEVMRLDSLDMVGKNREAIVAAAEEVAGNRVLITHGTDTMGETANLLASANIGKTIVLTGAMIPRGFPGSDAAFNVGVAYSAVQYLPPGVYIAMHGQVLPFNRFVKNREAGRFEAIAA